MGLRKNKRGSIDDLILVGVILLSFSVGTIVMFKISDTLNTEFQANTDITNRGKQSFNKINDMYSGVIDNSFLLLTIGLSVIALALAALVRFHPIFFVFYLILLTVIIFLSAIFSNIYLEIANNPEMIGLANQLTFTSHIMGALPFIIGIFGFLLAIVMYKNWRDTA